LTLGTDKFPNMTAVSNYYTATQPTQLLGSITGSATARETSYTNFNGVKFTPTSIPESSGTGSFAATAQTSTSSDPASSTTAPVSSTTGGNAAGRAEAQVAGGLLAAVLGVVALL
jgi:hypothetical protein